MLKTCSVCCEKRELSFFSSHKSTKDKLTTMCKFCVQQYNKKYRTENIDKINAVKKEYIKKNRDKIKNYLKIYHKLHPEKAHSWRISNPKLARESAALYIKNRCTKDPEYKCKYSGKKICYVCTEA